MHWSAGYCSSADSVHMINKEGQNRQTRNKSKGTACSARTFSAHLLRSANQRQMYITYTSFRKIGFVSRGPLLQTGCVCVYSSKDQLSVQCIGLLIEPLVCRMHWCMRVCQTEAEQLFQSFCIPMGPKVSNSVAFHSPAGGTACAQVSLPICVKHEIWTLQYSVELVM